MMQPCVLVQGAEFAQKKRREPARLNARDVQGRSVDVQKCSKAFTQLVKHVSSWNVRPIRA